MKKLRRMSKLTASKYFYKVKLVARNKKSNDEYSVITAYDRDYLRDSYNFAKAMNDQNLDDIKTGFISNHLKYVSFKLSVDTYYDTMFFLVEKQGDEEKEFLLSTLDEVNEENVQKDELLREEDSQRWSRDVGQKKRRYSRPLHEQFYFKSYRKEKQENCRYEVTSEEVFKCGDDEDFKNVRDNAKAYHDTQVREMEGFDPERERKNYEESGEYDYPIQYALDIIEILDNRREISHKWLLNKGFFSSGINLDRELRRKYYVESAGGGKRLILDMDL